MLAVVFSSLWTPAVQTRCILAGCRRQGYRRKHRAPDPDGEVFRKSASASRVGHYGAIQMLYYYYIMTACYR